MFCKKCRSMMTPSEGKWICKKCGYICDASGKECIVTERNADKEILVIDENTEILPKTKAECSKSGHNEAFWVLRQMRAADEPETRIYQCTKCKHKWREN